MGKLCQQIRKAWDRIAGDALWHVFTEVKRYFFGSWGVRPVLAILTSLLVSTWSAVQVWIDKRPTYVIVAYFLFIFVCVLTVIHLLLMLWDRWQRPPQLPAPIPPIPPNPSPSPIIPPTSPKVTFTLTSPQTTTLITTTRNLDKIICIKIISLPEHLPFARDLETALRAAGCQFMIDPIRNTTIFRARSVHENNRVVLRYRKSDTDSWLDFAHFILAKTLDAIIIPQLGLASLFTSSLVDLFPPETSADYFQIEIGGAP